MQHVRLPEISLPENETVIQNHYALIKEKRQMIKKAIMNETSRFEDGSYE